MIDALKVFNFAGPVTSRMVMQLQQFIQAWTQPVTACKLIGGVLVTASFPTANADVTVFHNLGTKLVACLPSVVSGPGFVYLSPNASSSQANAVVLRSSTPQLSVSLWFFPT